MLVPPPDRIRAARPYDPGMSPFWIRVQALIVIFVLAGMIVALTKLL